MIAMHLFYIPDFVHNFRVHGILWKQTNKNKRMFFYKPVGVFIRCENNSDGSDFIDLNVCLVFAKFRYFHNIQHFCTELK